MVANIVKYLIRCEKLATSLAKIASYNHIKKKSVIETIEK
jgi:hypothetical protein